MNKTLGILTFAVFFVVSHNSLAGEAARISCTSLVKHDYSQEAGKLVVIDQESLEVNPHKVVEPGYGDWLAFESLEARIRFYEGTVGDNPTPKRFREIVNNQTPTFEGSGILIREDGVLGFLHQSSKPDQKEIKFVLFFRELDRGFYTESSALEKKRQTTLRCLAPYVESTKF